MADAFARSGAEAFIDKAPDAGAEAADGDASAGVVSGPEAGADLLILNSCTVTSKAEQKARRIVRAFLAGNPGAAVIVTGCYAQLEADSIAALGERVLAVSGDGKDALLRLPAYLADNRAGHGDLLDALREWKAEARLAGDRFAFEPSSRVFHSRPSLKVQDGCDNCCAYCRVRIARGPSVSLDPGLVLVRARALEEAGAAEIVLTGVNLSQYRAGGLDFPALLDHLVDGTERVAFRLSSYEPDRVDERFLRSFADPRIRPHVHLAVQSGSDPVLAAMGRRYRRDAVLRAVRDIRAVKYDPFIGADLIVGFPGETEEDAASTLELARDCDFAWIHAFRFSPRPGTKAERMKGRVPERIAGQRAEALAGLARSGKVAYARRWLGAELEAVLEGEAESEAGAPAGAAAAVMRGTSANYIKLTIRGLAEGAAAGQAVVCRLESVTNLSPNCDASAVYIHNK